MPTSESGLQKAIIRAVKRKFPTAWCFHPVGNPMQMSGVPDLLICINGAFVGLELKHQKPGESVAHARDRATPNQLLRIDRIRAAGGTAGVVISVDEALSLCEQAIRR